MQSILRACYTRAAIASTFLITSAFGAQKEQDATPPAPIPAQILSGQTAFISYAGINSQFIASYIADHTGRPNGLYDGFYGAIKKLGKIQPRFVACRRGSCV